ncbi:hypothetical protein D3C80_1088660 [compost metagenome]
MGQVEQLIAYFTLFAQFGDEAAGHVFGHGFAGLLEHGFRRRIEQQAATALKGAVQGIEYPARADVVGHLNADRHAVHIERAAEVDDLCLGRHRVRHHSGAAGAGQQVGGTPVDVQHLAFNTVDGNPVIDLIRLGGIEHDAGEHVAQGALQCQTHHDGDDAGGRQQTFHRQLQHVAGGGHHGNQEHQCTDDILQQPAAMADAPHQGQADHFGQHPRGVQPPENPQCRGPQLCHAIIGKQRRLQRADAGVDEHRAEQHKQRQAHTDPADAMLERREVPQQGVDYQ